MRPILSLAERRELYGLPLNGRCFSKTGDGREYFFRPPSLADASWICEMVGDCAPLEPDSARTYLLLTTHFAETCAVAERGGKPVGFATAFISPSRPETLFVWQVAVDREERRHSVGKTLLLHIMGRPVCTRAQTIEALVGRSNQSSRAMFADLARDLGAEITIAAGFSPEVLPAGDHQAEELVRIGPLQRAR